MKCHLRIISPFFRRIFIPCPCTDQTSKKVMGSEFFCFLCSCNLRKDQVRTFRKSAVDKRLIKRALDDDVSLYSSSELFICTAIFYLTRLKRFQKITETMQGSCSQLYRFFQKLL